MKRKSIPEFRRHAERLAKSEAGEIIIRGTAKRQARNPYSRNIAGELCASPAWPWDYGFRTCPCAAIRN